MYLDRNKQKSKQMRPKINKDVLYWSLYASGKSKLPVFGVWAGNLLEQIGEINYDLAKFYESQEDLVNPDLQLRENYRNRADATIMHYVKQTYN